MDLYQWPTSDYSERLFEKLKQKGLNIETVNHSRYTEYFITTDNEYSEAEREKIKQIKDIAFEEIKQEDFEHAPEIFAEHIIDNKGLFAKLPFSNNPEKNEITYVPPQFPKVYSSLSEEENIYLDAKKLENMNNEFVEINAPSDKPLPTFSIGNKTSEYNLKIKINYPNGKHDYIVDGKKLDNVENYDYDLSQPQNLQAAVERDKLRWPSFSGTQKDLAKKMEEKGFIVEHLGRSCFESRNIYVIQKVGDITSEAVQEIKEALDLALKEKKKEKEAAFDKIFEDTSIDTNKTYSLVETGGEHHQEFTPGDKYDIIASDIIAFTQDSRQGRYHTELTLFINRERMKKDPRKFITLEVPKKIIGRVIGKGGSNIKALGQTYGKHFKVVETSEKLTAERMNAQVSKFDNLLKEGGLEAVLHGFDMTMAGSNLSEKDKRTLKESFHAKMVETQKQNQPKTPEKTTAVTELPENKTNQQEAPIQQSLQKTKETNSYTYFSALASLKEKFTGK